MSIVYNKDKRSGITYAYESKSHWDNEKKQSRPKRTLIVKVDKETGEIVATDGRCKKLSPYQKPKPTERDAIMDRIRPMGISETTEKVEIYKKQILCKQTDAKKSCLKKLNILQKNH
jgi:hypothetical protein